MAAAVSTAATTVPTPGKTGHCPRFRWAAGSFPALQAAGFVAPSPNRAPTRNNGVLDFSPQQSRIDIETRTPTSWGEARTFLAFDWAGCSSGSNFTCQTLQQSGGNSLLPRLRFAYGTLGGFLGGQALSNFSDADADTESMEFGGAIGSTGGQRIPQVRYTYPLAYGGALSVSAENPWTTVITPGGIQSSDYNLSGTGTATTPAQQTVPGSAAATGLCNGIVCTGVNGSTMSVGGTALSNPTVAKAPNLTIANYWSQPWGHVDFAGLARFYQIADGTHISQQFSGFGGHIAGDVHPYWFGYNKDDFLFSFVAGEAIGNYASGGLAILYPLASNYTVTTGCASPTNDLHRSVRGVEHSVQADLRVQHEWRLPALVDAEPADDDRRRLRQSAGLLAADRAVAGRGGEQDPVEQLRQPGVEPGRVRHHRRRVHVRQARRRRQPHGS